MASIEQYKEIIDTLLADSNNFYVIKSVEELEIISSIITVNYPDVENKINKQEWLEDYKCLSYFYEELDLYMTLWEEDGNYTELTLENPIDFTSLLYMLEDNSNLYFSISSEEVYNELNNLLPYDLKCRDMFTGELTGFRYSDILSRFNLYNEKDLTDVELKNICKFKASELLELRSLLQKAKLIDETMLMLPQGNWKLENNILICYE